MYHFMKKIYLIILILLTMNSISQAQTQATIQVKEAIETLRKMMIEPDKAVLEQIIAEELSYGHSSGRVENKSSFIESLLSGKSDFISIHLSEEQVQVLGNTAIVRHQLQAETMDGGQAGSVKLHILLVWQKQKNTWKLVARQAVKI